MDNTTPKYFVRFGGKVIGPLSGREVITRVMAGRLSALHEFSLDGKEWRYCVDLDDALSERHAPQPPPTPPAADAEAADRPGSRPRKEEPETSASHHEQADDVDGEDEDELAEELPEDRQARRGLLWSLLGIPFFVFAIVGIFMSANVWGKASGRRAQAGVIVGVVVLVAWIVGVLILAENIGWVDMIP